MQKEITASELIRYYRNIEQKKLECSVIIGRSIYEGSLITIAQLLREFYGIEIRPRVTWEEAKNG